MPPIPMPWPNSMISRKCSATPKNFGSSIDVGDATGAAGTRWKFVEDTHQRVFALNLKDRTKANVSMPWGDGDTHIRDILQLVRDKNTRSAAISIATTRYLAGSTPQAEVKRCMDFASGCAHVEAAAIDLNRLLKYG